MAAALTNPSTDGISVEKMTEYADMRAAYEQLCRSEDEIDVELDTLLAQQHDLAAKLSRLDQLLPGLSLLDADSRQLANMIGFTSTLADNVSSKVRQLDVAKRRVNESLSRVDDILDLKFCTDGVQMALQVEDYEQAAAHIHRFLGLDESALRDAAAAGDDDDAGEGGQLDAAFALLHAATRDLVALVRREFDDAVAVGDVASVERFFKIFPLLGLHDEGLRRFSGFLREKIAATARANLEAALGADPAGPRAGVLYTDALTLLLEGVARVVEIHQPLVETYYGPGRVLTFVADLQEEVDVQACRVIDEFRRARAFDHKCALVLQVAPRSSPGERLDPRELDVVLAEATLLNARAELYLRFVRRRAASDIDAAVATHEERHRQMSSRLDDLIGRCALARAMQELLGRYVSLEEYFMRESVAKAVAMDAPDDDGRTSSVVDDVFFVVSKCVRRAASSGAVDVVCALLNLARAVVETEYGDVLRARLRAGFPSGLLDLQQAYSVLHASLQQGKLSDADEGRVRFLVTLNDVAVSGEHLRTLRASLEAEFTARLSHAGERERAKLASCLTDLAAAEARFAETLEFGVEQAHRSAVRPRLKPWVEVFTYVSHDISEAEFSEYEANDPFVQGLVVNIESLLTSFRAPLLPANYDRLVAALVIDVAAMLEGAVLASRFNRLGGVQFDRELRALTGYLASASTWSGRERFARLSQIATILNLERVAEILDYWGANAGALTWRLTPGEVRQVLALRTDFRIEDIKRLKL
ncbi:PREDICTED: conserved oligomeric Golgi complex subunit 4-like [Priapulus caudatus]|uniref:Conserved oligomeric Golgi complex subunit 4 n=1 Tax=Priapulus caudatus TaxID=37621 RepID=A0ABM1E6D9_PRICU|nr:PREDICTED: conserved oligomeric Golgi complex subunit 4-like [Priapulus caudatus]